MRSRLPFNDKMLLAVAGRFRMMGDITRLRILQCLEGGARSVNQITRLLHANQANVSKHLQVLHNAGLLSRRRQGNTIFYAIADPAIFTLCDLVCRSASKAARKQYSELLGPEPLRS